MKKTFKSIISLLLIMAFLLTPYISTTVSAEEMEGGMAEMFKKISHPMTI